MHGKKPFGILITRKTASILFFELLYKLLLEVSFWKVLVHDYGYYELSFDPWKFLNGVICCVIAAILIDCSSKKASAFFLLLIFSLQIIPISVIYGMMDLTSPLYYNVLMFSFMGCELIVRFGAPLKLKNYGTGISSFIMPAFAILSVFFIILIVFKNGLPSTTALNIYSVYRLRANNSFVLGKYESYLMACTVTVFLPFLMIKYYLDKKYLYSALAALGILIIYLFTGQKTFLFSIPLCYFGVFFAKKKDCTYRFFRLLLLAFSAVCLLACVWPGVNSIMTHAYSMIVRRVLFVPARLKFIHHDYFSSHPKLFLNGTMPRAINLLRVSYYEQGVSYPFEIGDIYFNAPTMSAGTGVFAEAYARFGYIGIPFTLAVIAVILLQIDSLQNRTSFRTAIGFFLYPVYALSEQQIFGSLFFGSWMFLLIVLNHYSETDRGMTVPNTVKPFHKVKLEQNE